jgi:hypothetical protein
VVVVVELVVVVVAVVVVVLLVLDVVVVAHGAVVVGGWVVVVDELLGGTVVGGTVLGGRVVGGPVELVELDEAPGREPRVDGEVGVDGEVDVARVVAVPPGTVATVPATPVPPGWPEELGPVGTCTCTSAPCPSRWW